MAKILIIAAHPDDEILGCGATIAKLSPDNDVKVFWLGSGLDARGIVEPEVRSNLETAKRNALEILGATELPNTNIFPDQRFDRIDLIDIIQTVEEAIKIFQPDIIYTHSKVDLNLDHQITNKAVITATRPCSSNVKEIYTFEVLSSTEWNFNKSFSPNVFIDIQGKPLEKKLKALECYVTEMRNRPHARSLETVKALAVLRGSQSNLMAAESFELVRIIK